jgi:hypothetical protein
MVCRRWRNCSRCFAWILNRPLSMAVARRSPQRARQLQNQFSFNSRLRVIDRRSRRVRRWHSPPHLPARRSRFLLSAHDEGHFDATFSCLFGHRTRAQMCMRRFSLDLTGMSLSGLRATNWLRFVIDLPAQPDRGAVMYTPSLPQASMPTRHGGNWAKNFSIAAHLSWRLRTTAPDASIPLELDIRSSLNPNQSIHQHQSGTSMPFGGRPPRHFESGLQRRLWWSRTSIDHGGPIAITCDCDRRNCRSLFPKDCRSGQGIDPLALPPRAVTPAPVELTMVRTPRFPSGLLHGAGVHCVSSTSRVSGLTGSTQPPLKPQLP